MRDTCRQCGAEYGPDVAVAMHCLCPDCHTAAVEEMRARSAMPVGMQSSTGEESLGPVIMHGCSCVSCREDRDWMGRDKSLPQRQRVIPTDPLCPDCGTHHPLPKCGAKPQAKSNLSGRRRRNSGSGYSGGDGFTDI